VGGAIKEGGDKWVEPVRRVRTSGWSHRGGRGESKWENLHTLPSQIRLSSLIYVHYIYI